MRINIERGAFVGVSGLLANLHDGAAKGMEHAHISVPEVMEAEMSHIMLFQKIGQPYP